MEQAVTISERELFAEVLEREFRSCSRMLRAFPTDRLDERASDCACSARELAARFVERERAMHQVLFGAAGAGPPPGASLYEIQCRLEATHERTLAGLVALTEAGWRETVPAPAGLGIWDRARRGELLWLALKDLIRDDAHFALHLRLARQRGTEAYDRFESLIEG